MKPKYKARHRCKGHRWFEISSGFNIPVGFWYHYACLHCDNIRTTMEHQPTN